MDEYDWASDVAGRRNNQNMKLFKKTSNEDLVILKTFEIGENPENVAYFCNDAMIPVLLQSPWIPCFQNIFMSEEVTFQK